MSEQAESRLHLAPGTELVEMLSTSDRGGGRQFVARLRNEHGDYVLKHYGRKRGRFRMALRQFGSLALVGKSSILPRARRRVEEETLALWRSEGFDVPAPPPFPVEVLDPKRELALEWIAGTPITDLLGPGGLDPEPRAAILIRAAEVIGRRHCRALETAEPRLLFERPTLEHLLVADERFVHFDLEIVYTKRKRVADLVQREIASFLVSIFRSSEDDFPEDVGTFCRAYPDPGRLRAVTRDIRSRGGVALGRRAGLLMRLKSKGRQARRRQLVADEVERIIRDL